MELWTADEVTKFWSKDFEVSGKPSAAFTIDPNDKSKALLTITNPPTGDLRIDWDDGTTDDPVQGGGPHPHTYPNGTWKAQCSLVATAEVFANPSVTVANPTKLSAVWEPDPQNSLGGRIALTNAADGTTFEIDWDEGSPVQETVANGGIAHTYASPGTKTITIRDNGGIDSHLLHSPLTVTVTSPSTSTRARKKR